MIVVQCRKTTCILAFAIAQTSLMTLTIAWDQTMHVTALTVMAESAKWEADFRERSIVLMVWSIVATMATMPFILPVSIVHLQVLCYVVYGQCHSNSVCLSVWHIVDCNKTMWTDRWRNGTIKLLYKPSAFSMIEGEIPICTLLLRLVQMDVVDVVITFMIFAVFSVYKNRGSPFFLS